MNAQKDLVSIAMATYNGANYVAEQIDSILQQTYPFIEIVIVDDASKDNTVSIIEACQAQHPNVRLYRNEKNKGVNKTFEKAISLCNGRYIALSDQDDIWMPDKIETLLAEIGAHDAVYSNSMLVDERGRSFNKTFSSLMNLKSYYNGTPFLLSNTVPGHTILAKAPFLKSLMPFPAHLYFDLWIAFNAAAGNGIKYVDKVLVHYRQHASNVVGTRMSANKREKRRAKEQFNQKKRELETLATAPIKDGYTKKVLHEMISLFKRKWSFRRSAFFFEHFNDILNSKNKPYYRKVLFCFKMFFKPNY